MGPEGDTRVATLRGDSEGLPTLSRLERELSKLFCSCHPIRKNVFKNLYLRSFKDCIYVPFNNMYVYKTNTKAFKDIKVK